MSNVASFNLLKFVEHKPILNAKKIVITAIVFALVLLGYIAFQWLRIVNMTETITAEALNIQQLKLALQPRVHQRGNNPLVDVTALHLNENRQDFYREFEALSQINIPGLWLTEVTINRNPHRIKIKGAMDSSGKLDKLLQQLSQQPVFEKITFKGIEIYPEHFQNIPKEYQQELRQLKLPTLYHFIIQTTPFQSPEKK